MPKKYLVFVIVLGLAVVWFIWIINAKAKENQLRLSQLTDDTNVTVVASYTCGCCKLYAEYLKQQGFEVNLQTVSLEETKTYKDDNLVPLSLRSCHTSRIGDYVVEGHVPIEAIEKLLTENPDIAGIGMAGMPSGSPGMPGPKDPFIINIITKDGNDGGLFIEL